ncbi:hypothetical protein HDV00_007531 [Rhizophlyctis rosea]|nr:hypothetical protein HDV00_007531 [Rhizophlyctis rosea]
MLPEVDVTANFLTHYLPSDQCDSETKNLFHTALRTLCIDKFATSWDPTRPTRGNAYRAIAILEGRLDPLILSAAEVAHIPTSILSTAFPRELVLWCDPGSVSFRVGEYGFPTTIWEDTALFVKQSLSVPSLRTRTRAAIPFIAPSPSTAPKVVIASPSAEPQLKQHSSIPVQPILVS